MTDEEFAAIPRDWRCPPGWPSREQAEQMWADSLRWEKIIADNQPPAGFSQDIEKLKKDHPEMFDFADIPDLIPDKKHLEAMEKRMPQWLKDLPAQPER